MFKVSLLKQKSTPSTWQRKIVSILKSVFYSTLSFLLAIPKYVLYLFLFISLMALNYFYFSLLPDISAQLNTLVNFANGHGISLATLDENNVLVYTLCSKWPAGFVLFMTPIYELTKSTIGSVMILNGFCYLFYILFLDKYLKYLTINSLKQKCIIIFFIVSVAPFIHFHTPDLLATVVSLWGFYFTSRYLDHKNNIHLFLSVFLLALAYFIKYSFLPFVFFPFAAFVLKERKDLLRKRKQSLLIVALSLITLAFFYFLNKSIVGHNDVGFATTFDLFAGKAHWNQLTHFDGFLFTFGTYEWVIENLFKNHFYLHIQFNWISVLITAYFYFLFLQIFFKTKDNYSYFFYNSINVSLSAGALIIAFLTFLTLNNPGQTWTTPYWTFVQETRYYGPVIVIGLINILVIFFNEKKGRLIHIIVPLMLIFNLYAYRTIIQGGFWGNNFASYKMDKAQVYSQINNSGKQAVFYYQPQMRNSMPYLILQSEGEILIKGDSILQTDFKDKKYQVFLLKKEEGNNFKITSIN